MEKHKYVIIGDYDSVVIFPMIIEHSEFRSKEPKSAGFCYINTEKKIVECFGKSVSLGIESRENEDSVLATKQFFGWEAAKELINQHN